MTNPAERNRVGVILAVGTPRKFVLDTGTTQMPDHFTQYVKFAPKEALRCRSAISRLTMWAKG